jgi:predicted MFS family arabinose efflux permease
MLLAIIMAILNSDANVMAPKLATIREEFGVSDSSIGLMKGLFTFLGALVSLFWGYFSDKTSRKRLFVAAVLIGELPCALTAFAYSYPLFFGLRILSGIGLGAAYPLVFSIIGDTFEAKERSKVTAVISVAIAAGTILGILAGGYIGGEHNWRLAFLASSLPNLIFIALFWLACPEAKKAASEEATRELVEAGLVYPKTIRLADYAGIFRNRTNLMLLLQGIAGTIPWGSFFFINEYLNKDKGLSVTDATNVFSFFGIGMVVGVIAGGIIGGAILRRSARALPVFCALTTLGGAAAVIYVIVGAPSNFPILAAFGFLAAFLAAMTGPNMKTMLLDVNAPEERGAVFSIFNLTDSLGTGLGGLACGILSSAVGLGISLTICSAFWVFCTVFLLIVSGFYVADIALMKRRMEEIAVEMRAGAKA